MNVIRIVALLPMVFLLSCASRAPAESALTAQDYYLKWSAQSQNYQVSFQQSCYCMPDNIRPMRVTVRENKIVSAVFEDDQSIVPDNIIKDLMTIDTIFQVIVDAEAKPAHRFDVEFDRQNYFPLTVDIDYDSRIADDEIRWQLSRLVRVN